jgi:hypothetical protein
MTFALTALTSARLHNVNIRSEQHGKDVVPAVDLKLSIDAANGMLDQFDDQLRGMLYHRAAPAPDGTQPGLDGVDEISDVPNLRAPLLQGPFKWGKDFTGYTLTIDYGTGGKSNIELAQCLVNQIAFEPKEGGTVSISWRLQCAKGLDEKVLGKLATLVQHDVQIMLEPPTLADDLVSTAAAPDVGDPPAQQTPEEALAATAS